MMKNIFDVSALVRDRSAPEMSCCGCIGMDIQDFDSLKAVLSIAGC